MGGVCVCRSWMFRPVWPVFIILAAVPCALRGSESPAAVVGKMYPRGNHWAVGHLMGKKSVESLAEPPRDARREEPQPPGGLLEALLQPGSPEQRVPQGVPQSAGSGWREEDRDKYLREMPDLLLLALNLRDGDSD